MSDYAENIQRLALFHKNKFLWKNFSFILSQGLRHSNHGHTLLSLFFDIHNQLTLQLIDLFEQTRSIGSWGTWEEEFKPRGVQEVEESSMCG